MTRTSVVLLALAVVGGSTLASVRPGVGGPGFPDSVVAHIAVGGDPTNVTALPNGEYLYVGNETVDYVTVVRLTDRTVVGTIPAGQSPWELSASPDRDYVYVSNEGSNSVSVIRTADNVVVATVPVGASPCLIAFRPSGDYAYVSNNGDGTVSVIRTADHTVVATVQVGGVPRGITCLPNGQYVYVANLNDSVSVIRTSDNSVVASVPFSCSVHRACATSDGSSVYVTPYGGNRVFVIRTSDNAVVDSFVSGSNTVGMTMYPGTDYAYIVNGGENTVSVARTSTDSLITKIPTGSAPWGVAAPATGDFVYTADRYGQSVTVIGYRYRHDVCPVRILSPTGVVDSGRVVEPMVLVKNFGTTADVFPVTMSIGAGYADTVQDTLPAGLSDTVRFQDWVAMPEGTIPVTCLTSLAADENATNDTTRGLVLVVPPPVHDVGAVAILAPPGILRVGDTVMPKVRIKNFGNRAERLFGVQFRISAGYDRTLTVSQALQPDSTMELTSSAWVAPRGQWAVSCSTMLASDVNRDNDKVSSTVQTLSQALQVRPDQADQLQAGQTRTYRFYALVQGDTGSVVEVARPSAPPGWSVRLCDAAGTDDLADTDEDGIPDLGYVVPGDTSRFSLDVTAALGLIGDTASLAARTFLVAGRLSNDSMVADTAVLNLTLVPTFSVHNFPNPFSDHTAFVIGLPEDGNVSLTVYTRAGERVRRVQVPTDMVAGVHVVAWDGTNDNGRAVVPGTYEYVLDYEHAGKTDPVHKKLVRTKE